MNKLLLALGSLAASVLLVPGEAAAQRGGFGGGRGGGISGGFPGGGPSFRSGGGGFGGRGMMIRSPGGGGFRGGIRGPGLARPGFGGPRIGGPGRGFPGGAVGVRPGGVYRGGVAGNRPGFQPGMGGYRRVAVGYPAVRYGDRQAIGRYGVRAPGYYGRVSGAYRPIYRGYYGRRYPYYGGYYGGWGWDDDWGWGAAGLVAGSVIGATVASTYPVYATPTLSAIGGYCATPVRTCALIDPAPVGTGCSCRTAGGRARGTVALAP